MKRFTANHRSTADILPQKVFCVSRWFTCILRNARLIRNELIISTYNRLHKSKAQPELMSTTCDCKMFTIGRAENYDI